MKKLLFLLILSVGWAMNSYAQAPKPRVIEITGDDLKMNPSKLSEVASSIRYVKLETRPDALVGDASRYFARGTDGGFLVYQTSSQEAVLLFDGNGKFIVRIGQIGRGPGEYTAPYKVVFDEYSKSILILTRTTVLEYDVSGKLQNTINLPSDFARIDRLLPVDKSTWMMSYQKPLEGDLNETGVILVDRKGNVKRKFDLTDKSQPGSYGVWPQLNYLYKSGEDILFAHYNYEDCLRFDPTGNGDWKPAYEIKAPVSSIPIELCGRSSLMKVDEYAREHGKLMGVTFLKDRVQIELVTPMLFNFYINLNDNKKYTWSFVKEFNRMGFDNDLDGGPAFAPRNFYGDNEAVDMINASELLDFLEKDLYGKSGKDPKMYQAFMKLLDSIKADDNPVIRIVTLKK